MIRRAKCFFLTLISCFCFSQSFFKIDSEKLNRKKFLIEFFKQIFHSALVEKGNVSFNIEIIILAMRDKLIFFNFNYS